MIYARVRGKVQNSFGFIAQTLVGYGIFRRGRIAAYI